MLAAQKVTPIRVPSETDALPAYDVRELIKDGVQARMILDGTTYFLRITRAGKLILTK